MFASLKSKIKEETGSDLNKLTSTWRSGAFLSRITQRDDSTASPSSSGAPGDSTTESISPQLDMYLSERTGGHVDHIGLQQQYSSQLEDKLKERDALWERKFEQLKITLSSSQSEEAIAAQTVARTAQAEAAKAIVERDTAEKQLSELRARLSAAERAQDKLDTLTEELESSRREWSRERAALSTSLNEAEAHVQDLRDQLTVLRAALPIDDPKHQMHDDVKKQLTPTGCEDYDRVCREKAVLTRQLQETKMALQDVKTSWSGQIASLETQVARLSRQAGEEGAERRRVEIEKKELYEKLINISAELEKTKQNLVNSEAKVVRLNGEVHSLAMEVKSLRNTANVAAEKALEMESRLNTILEQNKELIKSLEQERALVKVLEVKLEQMEKEGCDKDAEIKNLNVMLHELQNDCFSMERKLDKEKREKDDALLRNAHMSQSIEISQSDVRYQETEITELKTKITQLEDLIGQHKENQAACMIIKESEESRKAEIVNLKQRIEELNDSERTLQKTVQDLETDISDKNKKIKTLDNRISDMKKTLQRELQSSKTDLSNAEEADISRRYLKHVVLRFLTARELEARQLTRALSTLLRLSAHEEALLRAALPPRSGLSSWFPSLNTT